MALTKVSGDFIQDGSITQGHLHASHGITTSDIGEGSNLYFTTARVDSRIGNLSTSDLSEGTNLYYTDARADARIALQVGSNLDLSSKSTSDLSEGTNLYYTDARVGSYLTTNSYATQSYVNTQVSNLVDSAPSTLDTLNELAAALGDDANFSTTVTNSIATKLPLAGGTLTGALSGTSATFSGNVTGANLNISNWDTAYGWGNHASGGYAADSAVMKLTGNQTISGTKTFDNGSIVISGTHGTISFMDTTSGEDNFYLHANSNNFYVLADRDATDAIDGGYESPHPLQLEADTNTAYVFGSALNIGNWDTAYGWGNHASAGYLASSSYTASDVLTKIKTVDGSGSGLDADLLDGSHKTDIQRELVNVTSVTAADSCLPSTGYGFKHFLGIGPSNNDGHILGMSWTNTSSYGAQIYVDTDPNNIMAFRSRSAAGVWTGWNTVWHTNNDGSGSGLDADLLDGIDSGSFVRSDADDSLSGQYTFTKTNDHAIKVGTIRGTGVGTQGGEFIHMYERVHIGSPNGWGASNTATPSWGLSTHGGTRLAVYSDYTQSGGSMRAPIFYDSNDTNHYLDPASTSVVNTLKFSGSSNNGRFDADEWGVRFKTDAGYILFGPANTGHAHIYTDRSNFYFDKQIILNGGSTINAADIRASVFYDINDTNYYTNPNSQSSLLGVAIRGDLSSTATDNQIFFWGTGNTTTSAIGFKANGGHFTNPTGTGDGYNTYLTMDTSGRGWVFRQGTGSNNFTSAYNSGWILNNGIWQANASMRAPIFYDSNDTTYYIDGATLSRLHSLKLTKHINHTPRWDFSAYVVESTHYYNTASTGDMYIGESNYINIRNTADIHGDARAPIYYDRNNTGYYMDPDSTSRSGLLRSYLLFNDYGAGVVGTYDSYRYQLVFAMGDAYKGALNGTNVTGGYGLWWSHPNAGGVAANLNSHGLMNIDNGNWQASFAGSTRAAIDMRAPIFYDQNNTGYYVNPDGASNVNAMTFAGVADFNGGHGGINITNTSILSSPTSNWTGNPGGAGKIQYHANRWYIVSDSSSNRIVQFRKDGSDVSYIDNDGRLMNAPDLRAPIFYNSNDTNSYFSTTRVIMRGTDPTVIFRDTDHNSAMIHVNSSIFYVLRGGNDTTSWATTNGYWPLEINLTNNDATFGRNLFTIGYVNAPIFYDRDNTSYYVDPHSTSNLYIIYAQSDMRAPIYYDINNTAYYTRPSSYSYMNQIWTAGVIQAGSSGTGDIYLGNNGISGSGNHFRFHTASGATYFDMNSGTINWREGSSTRYYFYPSTASITINGTLTQYSDIRCKENIVEIPDAIDKIKSIRGVYYNRTDFNTEPTKIGVIAQEVEVLMPELILQAEDTDMKSVSYNELTAVLVQAIKEQQTIIDDLKARIETLENQ